MRLPITHLQKLRLIQNPDPELLRLVELGPGFFAGQNVIGFLTHAAGHFAAGGFKLSPDSEFETAKSLSDLTQKFR